MDEEDCEPGAGGHQQEEEAAELGKVVIPVKMEEQGNSEGKNKKGNVYRTLQKLRTELEECHRQGILKLKETCIKELNVKYKNDLEQIKNLITTNSEVEVQNLNIMTYFNNKLQESDIQSTSLYKELENCIEGFLQECSEIDLKSRTLVEELTQQLTNTEECTKETEKSNHEMECLNKRTEELDTIIQKLNNKLVLEAEKNKSLNSWYDKEISKYDMKLKDLEAENMLLQEVSEKQKTKLREMQSILYQYEHELQLTNREMELSHNVTVDTLINVLEDANQNKVKTREGTDGFEYDNYLKGHMVELRPAFEGTDKLAIQQEQLAMFNSQGNTDHENTTWNTSQYGEALESESCKSMYSFEGQMHPNSLAQEALNENEPSPKSTALSLSGCSPQSEIEEYKDVVNDQIDLVMDIIKHINGKDATGEISSVYLKEQVVHVGPEEFHSRKMEMELENKRKQGENDDVHNLNSFPWEEMVKDLQQEKEALMVQLRVQEQLVKDVQEQKTASDSVTSEVQCLFGRQLAVLQRQRDQMQAQLDIQKAKNKTLSELLGQKTMSETLLLKEQEDFRSKINDKKQSLSCLIKEKSTLEEKLLTLEKNLIVTEKALKDSINNVKILEQTVDELNMKIKNIEELSKSEFEARNSELDMLHAETALKEKEYMQEKNKLSEEVAFLKKSKLNLETHLEEILQKSVQNIEETQSEMRRHHNEEIRKTESHYQSEVTDLKLQHQQAIELLNAEIRERMEKQQQLEAERKEQIGIIKKVHEREHDREIAELIDQHEDEIEELRTKLTKEQQQLLDELQQKMETIHHEEMQQAEALHNLKVEALRLSSNNIYTSQLELMQTNLRKEKETALIELRETLSDKHAQEIAVLQSRYQLEMEHIKEKNQEEKEEIAVKHQCDLDREKKTAIEIEEKNTKLLEGLKKEWQLNADNSLKNMSEELSVRHQTELNEMKRTLKAEVEELKGRLESLSFEKEQAEGRLESLSFEKEQAELEYKTLENHYHLANTKLQTEHEQKLQEMKDQSKKREEELQQEVGKIQAEFEKLKTDSQEEIRQLWSQLDSARASRQELSELKEQLLSRTSHMEEIEYLKKDFQLKWDKNKSAHETELEQLRLYFEQKLKAVEENYREELMMLHQRLQEVKDYSLLELENDQDQQMEFGPSMTLLEEMTEKERHNLFEQLTQQLEHHKEELSCLQLHLNEKHKHEVELLRSSLAHQYQENLMRMKVDLSDRYTSEIEELKRKHCLNLEELRANISEEHLREITKIHLQNAQNAAHQVETEVSERFLMMENEYKTKLDVFEAEKQSISTQQEEIDKLKRENNRLKEIGILEEIRFKKELEQIKYKLVEEHAKELRRTREEVQEVEQIHKAKTEEWKWKWEDLKTKSEEKLSLVYKELENKAEVEKQALQKQFELREAEMTLLQTQQAAKIVELEKSLKEQQNSVRQLEDSLLNTQKSLTQYDNQLASTKDLMVKELEKTKRALQEEYEAKLKDTHNRFIEERKAMTAEHEMLAQELKGKHVAELDLQSNELQHKHKEHILSLTSDLQGKHEAEASTLRSTLERKHQAQLQTHITDIQKNHHAQIRELEAKHLTHLDTLESTYLSEIQLLRDEHKQALEDFQIDLREQLLQKDKANEVLLAQELDKMKLRHGEELQICQDNLKIELTTVHIEKLKIMSIELKEAHKEDLTIALEKQSRSLEDRYHKALDMLQGEVFHLEEQHKKTLQEIQDLHVIEVQKEKENGQLLQKATEKLNSDKQQLEEEVASLNRMTEDSNGELKNLLEQRDRENKEGETLVALLRSDIEFSRNERKKLQECCQQALKLLLKMVKATKDTEDLICNKIGLCLDDTLAFGDSRKSHIITGEIILASKHKTMATWVREKSDGGDPGKVLDQTPPEYSFDSSVPDEISELSQHLCESIFENPDLVFENEERIHKIGCRLYIAVEKLLELVAVSTKELEATHKIPTDFEEQFNWRNWEACQVNEHSDLMDCLKDESEAKNQLSLELHKAKSLIEGYLAEKCVLEEALILKEESVCRLAAELESMKAQFQELTQEHARSIEEQQLLINQNKALASNLGEREVDLLKEVDHLAKAKLDLQCQAEKDCSTMNAQMKILEMELEEQINKNQKMTTMSLEVTDLRQQIQALERQLKNQRDFMDKQAVEREHERDEFQEEIQKLEKQLKQMAKCEVSEQSREYEVESLHCEIKERRDAYDKLFLNREQLQKELAVQNEEIKKLEARTRELECLNMEGTNNADQLSKELQELKKIEVNLKQDNDELQQQQYNNLIQISSLQSELDAVRHRVLTEDSLDQMLKEKLKTQEELLIKEREVEDLLEQLQKFKENLMNQNEEISQLTSKLEMEKSTNFTKIIELQEENVQLREKMEKPTMQSQNQGDNVAAILQFLKTLLEEKNEETDHLNELIMILEHKLENSKNNEVLEKQMFEIEDMKSTIEHLRGDKEGLLRNKTEEIEQLHGVIKKLQMELALLQPIHHEVSDSQGKVNNFVLEMHQEDLPNRLNTGSLNHLGNSGEGDNYLLFHFSQEQLQEKLDMVLADREALQQLLVKKESQFKMETNILEQNLQNVQASSRQHLTELTALQLQYNELEEEHKFLEICSKQRDTEMTLSATCIKELEDQLRETEAKLSATELQLQAVSEQKAEQAAEVQQIKGNVVQLENDLQALLQTLCDKEATYQGEISKLQAAVVKLNFQIERNVNEQATLRSERDLFHAQLKSYMEKIQEDAEEETILQKLVSQHDAFGSPEEIKEEREPSNNPSESDELSCDTLEENIIVTNLKMSHKDLNVQDECLQGMLLIQKAAVTSTIKEQPDLKSHFQQMLQLKSLSQSSQLTQKIFENVQTVVTDETSWDSPERMRKQNSMELQANLSLTPFLNIDGTDSIGFESLCSDSSIEQEETSGLLGYPSSYSNGNEKIATHPSFQFPALSGLTENGVQETTPVRDAEGFILMPSEFQDDLRSTMSRLEGASIDYGSNSSSDLVLQLNQENPEATIHQDGNVLTYLQCFGIVPDITKSSVKEKDTFSQQLKNVLKMVYEESYKILVLSEKPLPLNDKKIDQPSPSADGWQRERLTLLDAIQSLKDYLSKVPTKDDKESSSAFFDWRGEVLHAVQCVLEKERSMLQSYLQSHFCNPGAGDEGSLVEKLEHIVKQQEQQQKIVLEHLLSSDRNSLLIEIQDLQAQLRLMHFQSQEKLQQLQETLINTENHGSQQEHQLRRQVELLEYKLQQEKSIASDLQVSLKNEQEKATELHELLKQEHNAILNLKSDLSETKQTNEKLQKSLLELQKEVVKYSSALEDKDKAMTALLQDFQNKHLKEEELQNTLDKQQNQHKIREDEKSKALEELQAALELQCIQNNQLSVALEHEQVANSNLRKELQIDNSRYEALLSQDQNKLLELQRTIDVEKNRSLELLSALKHERVLTEQLSMRINECLSCKHKDSLQELQAQLCVERSHARELAVIIEKTRQQVLVSKKHTSETQMCHEEPQKEKDLSTSLKVTQAFLQNQKQDIIHALEVQEEKEAQLKMEWKHLQSILRSLREQENRIEQRAKERQHEQQTERDQLKELKKAQENQHELELQQWQISGRVKELQQMLVDLKEQEICLNSHNSQHRLSSSSSKNYYSTNLPFTTDAVVLHVKQQKLENIREQLLVVASYLSEFIYKTVNKAANWPAPNGEAVGVLLRTLEELKTELLSSSKSVVTPTCIINSMPESEGIAWQERKPVLQNGLKAMEYEATKTHFVMESKSMGPSNLKVQKLYRKYLRAESFRKALVYQKKYLLLLLGGFQECEQATLSLIARMGIYPSPPELNTSKSRSRSFTKFRSVVRVVIAVSRLKFLVKKWHKVSRKEILPGATSLGIGSNSESSATQEAGYSNRNDCVRLVNSVPKSPHHLHNRFMNSASQVSSKDPEHSLTEYISHLEAIQQRLGIIMPGLSPGQEKLQML